MSIFGGNWDPSNPTSAGTPVQSSSSTKKKTTTPTATANVGGFDVAGSDANGAYTRVESNQNPGTYYNVYISGANAGQIVSGTGTSSKGPSSTSGVITGGLDASGERLIGQEIPLEQQTDDVSEYINQLKEAQKQSRIAALDKARQTALGSLDTEQANVAPTYYDKRNQAAAASDVSAMNFAQYMAARGIKGPAGAMPEIYRNAGLQGQMGALDRDEAATLAGIERQRSNVESGYASDVAAANADVDAQAMQAYIDQWNLDRNYRLALAGLTGSLGDERTLAGQEFDYSKSPSNPAVQALILANQKASLDNAYQEILNSYAPETIKNEALLLKQKVDAGQYDVAMALAQLDQYKAQAANYWRDANAPYTQSTTQATNTAKAQGDEYIRAYKSTFKRPIDMSEQARRNYEAGTMSQSTYNYVAKYLQDNYDPYSW